MFILKKIIKSNVSDSGVAKMIIITNKKKKLLKKILSEVGFESTPGEPDHDLNAALKPLGHSGIMKNRDTYGG